MLLAVVSGAVLCGVREELVGAALKSPELVGGQRKEEWLQMYTEGGIIEDPVGGTWSGSGEERSRFWDMFIQGKKIVLIPEYEDIVDEANHVVVRTLNIQTDLYGWSILNVPLHVKYEFKPEDGLKLTKLQAFWDASESAPLSSSFSEMPSFGLGSILALKQIYDASGVMWLSNYLTNISLHNCGPSARDKVQQIFAGDGSAAVFAESAAVAYPLQGKTVPANTATLKHEIFNVHSSGAFVSFSIKSPSTTEPTSCTAEKGEECNANSPLPKAGAGFVKFISPANLTIEGIELYIVD